MLVLGRTFPISRPWPKAGGLSWDDASLVPMSNANREGIFQRTKEALQLLACSPAVQFRLLPSFVCVGDELALDFNHWQGVMTDNFSSELTPEQIASLAAIDETFSRFSKLDSEYSEDFWTDEAVRKSLAWENIRQMARRALSLFGWPEEEPPSHAHEFVKGSAS
jgi:hypothetical protein